MDQVSPIRMFDFLRRLGFTTDGVGLSYSFHSFKVSATECLVPPMMGVHLSGVKSTPRDITTIDYRFPLEIESEETGFALLAYALRHVNIPSPPWWLEKGRELSLHLPWVRDMEAYANRPQCTVAREWARLGLRTLKEHVSKVTSPPDIEIAFDGKLLTMTSGDQVIAMPASGAPWPHIFRFSPTVLGDIPKRLRDPVYFSICRGRLSIQNRSFSLAD